MKIKVSNYIAGKLVEAGINQVFTVTGGGAMHLRWYRQFKTLPVPAP